MRDDVPQATETSPLLRNQSALIDAGDAPNGGLSHGSCSNGSPETLTKPGDDVEGQRAEGDITPRYEGLPEVKKNMKYILPAIAIGVCCSTHLRARLPLTWRLPGFPLGGRSDDHCVELWEDWQRFEGVE